MHENNFLELSQHRIISIDQVDYNADNVKAIITSVTFDRITTKPYIYSFEEFKQIKERGYLND